MSRDATWRAIARRLDGVDLRELERDLVSLREARLANSIRRLRQECETHAPARVSATVPEVLPGG